MCSFRSTNIYAVRIRADYEQAIARLSFEGAKNVLIQVNQYLRGQDTVKGEGA